MSQINEHAAILRREAQLRIPELAAPFVAGAEALEAVEVAKAALKKASKFISYARYELEPETIPGRQFPSQPEADEHIEMITAALARLEGK